MEEGGRGRRGVGGRAGRFRNASFLVLTFFAFFRARTLYFRLFSHSVFDSFQISLCLHRVLRDDKVLNLVILTCYVCVFVSFSP